jgi:pimeloyl-ACP methyl ester carboxylesterase
VGAKEVDRDMSVQPFEVRVPQATLDDLRERLAATRWPDEVSGAGWDYGANLEYMRELVGYWLEDFDWRTQEERINSFDHFRAEVDGLTVHFVRERGGGENPLPLLALHGWPGSFYQMMKVIPLLADPGAHGGDPSDSFDVVALSLPGYGFSERPTERGMSAARVAELLHKLMAEELGYERYATRASDLGAGVSQQLALSRPEALLGLHHNGTNPYVGEIPDDLTQAEKVFVQRAQAWGFQEMAYAMEHSSKPQTLAYGLNDSPAGLAAWIIEKLWRWSDNDGNLESRFPKDELLANLTIYWATETIGSSVRLYYETARDPGSWGRVEVPTAMMMSPKDMFPTPREWVERSYNVTRWTDIDRGGHFLEWEEPELVAEDARAFFRPLREDLAEVGS